MPDEVARVTVDNHELWGKLVKMWATGDGSYLGLTAPLPITRSIAELKQQAASIPNLGLNIPSSVTGLAVVQYSPETFVLRLPPKSMIEDSERTLRNAPGDPYPLPSFYSDFFQNSATSVEDKLDFHASRIGDYTITNCG